jgi:hypothetical protein
LIVYVIVVMIALAAVDVILRRLAAQPSEVNNIMSEGARREYWNGFRNAAAVTAICLVAAGANMLGKNHNVALIMPFVIIAYVFTKRQFRNSLSLLQASRRGSVANVSLKLHGGMFGASLEFVNSNLPPAANKMRVSIKKPSVLRRLREAEQVPAQAFLDESGLPVAVQLHSGEVVMRL